MKLTIFTPTYNRGNKLQRLYESLLQQVNCNFEWLIVDDGSTDDTNEVVSQFQKQHCSFDIRYYQQKNGGKHRAYNTALPLARGEYFFCLDSDDWLAPNAISSILSCTDKCAPDQTIIAYKTDETGLLLSDKFPANISNTTMQELFQARKCYGEFSFIIPTATAQDFPFPEFEGEKFVTESVVYDRIGKISTVYLLPQIITICEYQENGLTSRINQIMKANPAGFCLYFMQRIDLQKQLINRLITAGKYQCFCLYAKGKNVKYSGKYKTEVLLAKPIGYVFWLYYKLLRGF